MFHCPHIVDTILRFTNRNTLVTCLRVNKKFFNASGALLYHTVRVDTDNMAGLFLGAVAQGTVDNNTATDKRPVRTSFKNNLLAKVQVVSIGSNFPSHCLPFSGLVPAVFSGVHTVRFVPTVRTHYEHEQRCGQQDSTCPLLHWKSIDKLVVRNVDMHTSYLPLFLSSNAPKSLVIVVPTAGDRFGFVLRLRNATHKFPAATKVKILLEDSWETWELPHHSQPTRVIRPAPPEPTIHSSQIVDMHAPRQTPVHIHTVYGLEGVPFHLMQHQNPEVNAIFDQIFGPPPVVPTFPATREAAQEEVKDAIMARFSAFHPPPNGGSWVVFKTMEDYAALDPTERQYELDDGLDKLFI